MSPVKYDMRMAQAKLTCLAHGHTDSKRKHSVPAFACTTTLSVLRQDIPAIFLCSTCFKLTNTRMNTPSTPKILIKAVIELPDNSIKVIRARNINTFSKSWINYPSAWPQEPVFTEEDDDDQHYPCKILKIDSK